MTCPKCKRDPPPDAMCCPWCGRKLTRSFHKRKPKRSPNGTGYAYQRPGQKTWTAEVVVGYRDPHPLDLENPDNKKQRVPIKKTKGGFETKAKALAYCPTLKAEAGQEPVNHYTLQQIYDM